MLLQSLSNPLLPDGCEVLWVFFLFFCQNIWIYNINCITLLSDLTIYCMKTQLSEQQSIIYSKILQHCALQIMVLGGQKKAARALGIDPSNLSKYLSGVIDPNSKLFFKILDYCNGSVFFGVRTENGVIFPTCQF